MSFIPFVQDLGQVANQFLRVGAASNNPNYFTNIARYLYIRVSCYLLPAVILDEGKL